MTSKKKSQGVAGKQPEAGTPVSAGPTRAPGSVKEDKHAFDPLRSLVEHLSAGALYVGPNRICMNRVAEAITGYGCDELTTLDQWFASPYGARWEAVCKLYESTGVKVFRDRDGPYPPQGRPGAACRVCRLSNRQARSLADSLPDRSRDAQDALLASNERREAIRIEAIDAIITIDQRGIV